MSKPAIVAEDIVKTFRVYRSPGDLVWEVLLGKPHHRDFTALDKVSFTVGRGEVVGLIGRNGAGKSTLLKIIAGTLAQSAGNIEIDGRVSAILELGTGFNPEYTGRENIYLGGLCLGLTRAEIRAREDEIIAFSELEEFIDQPFKTYSSGMQARLTFSVAVSVDPDILIIDEALSVGDAKFQLKSFNRIKSFRERGKTILVVSHDINTLAVLCDRAILLDHGRLIAQGDSNDVGKQYHGLLFGPQKDTISPAPPSAADGTESRPGRAPKLREHRYGDYRAIISDVFLTDPDGRATSRLETGKAYRIQMVVEANSDLENYELGLMIRTPRGVEVMGTDTRSWEKENFPKTLKAGQTYRFAVEFVNHLYSGFFFLTAAIALTDETKIDMRLDCLMFEVVAPRRSLFTNSLVYSDMRFSCEHAAPRASGEEPGKRPAKKDAVRL